MVGAACKHGCLVRINEKCIHGKPSWPVYIGEKMSLIYEPKKEPCKWTEKCDSAFINVLFSDVCAFVQSGDTEECSFFQMWTKGEAVDVSEDTVENLEKALLSSKFCFRCKNEGLIFGQRNTGQWGMVPCPECGVPIDKIEVRNYKVV